MIEFLSTDDFSVYKKNNDNTFFSIEFQQNNGPLINSLIKTKLIIASSISDDYDSFSFRASSVKSFKKFMSKTENINYENALKIILSLTKQFQYLITKEKLCFYKYIIENIIVIDNEKFIYLSNEELFELSESNKIQFVRPFNYEGFISPELLKINCIPSEINYKTVYYSLGSLVVYFLFKKNIINNENNNENNNEYNNENNTKSNTESINEILNPIEGTKLFELLIRCLYKEASQRAIIYF
jgi:hypothetical protein